MAVWLLQSQLRSQQASEDAAKLAETLEEENEMLRSELEDLLREKEELGQFLKQQVHTKSHKRTRRLLRPTCLTSARALSFPGGHLGNPAEGAPVLPRRRSRLLLLFLR